MFREATIIVRLRTKILHGLLFPCCLLLHSSAQARQTAEVPQTPPTAGASKPLLARSQHLTNELLAGKVTLNVKAQSLADIVDTLATKLHCSILVDDDPLLGSADVQCDGTGKDALDKVTDVFDYTWETSPSGGVLMRKRFRNPIEHPQMNYAELKQMAHDAVAILGILHFNPQYYQETWPFILRELYESFTPEQRVIFTDETKSLTMPQLAPAQRSLVEKAIYCAAFQNQIRAWNTFANQLDALPNGWMQRELLFADVKNSGAPTNPPPSSNIIMLNLHLPLRGGHMATVNLASTSGKQANSRTKENKR